MATGLAEIIILSLIVSWLLNRLGVPALLGMLAIGVVFGPYVLGVLDPALLAIGTDLRLIALIVILMRAGFQLSRQALHRVGGRALLLSFVPATCEGLAVTLVAPPLLGLTVLEAALLGSILAAVSPAVVVPMMIQFMQRRMGAEKEIPSLVLAGASMDDIYVIVVHSALLGFYAGQSVDVTWRVASVPLSLVAGAGVGAVVGWGMYRLFDRFNPRATKRVLTLLAVAILLTRAQQLLAGVAPFSAFVATMAMGVIILERREHYAHEISAKLAKIWVFAEIVLFTLVGAEVNVSVAWQAGLAGAAVVALGLVARGAGVYLCLLKSELNLAERLFVIVAYLPKATVQAAIAAGPLALMRARGMDTGPGEIIVAVGVLSIILTAPVGAWAIARLGERVLQPAPEAARDAYDAAMESGAGEEI